MNWCYRLHHVNGNHDNLYKEISNSHYIRSMLKTIINDSVHVTNEPFESHILCFGSLQIKQRSGISVSVVGGGKSRNPIIVRLDGKAWTPPIWWKTKTMAFDSLEKLFCLKLNLVESDVHGDIQDNVLYALLVRSYL